MRVFFALLALVAFSGAAMAGAGCSGIHTAGTPPVIASTDGVTTPQTPVVPPSTGDKKG